MAPGISMAHITDMINQAAFPGQSKIAGRRTGGQMIAASLLLHGVDVVFCVPGECCLDTLDAFYAAAPKIKLISCRHEQGAANMAEAYAKLTGKPGVCMVSRGPGACNASIGVHTAKQDSTPLLLLAGQAKQSFMGRESFQEADIKSMFAPIAKRVERADDASHLPRIMALAFQAALSSRQGPAVVELPEDIHGQISEASDEGPYEIRRAVPKASQMALMLEMLGRASRPVMLAGGGGWSEQGRKDILAFAEACGIPACVSFRRNDLIDNRHFCYAGELGVAANPLLVKRVREADLLLAAGTRLDEVTTQGYALPNPSQSLIHVHAEASELGRVFKPDLAIHAAPDEFAAAAISLKPVDSNRGKDWARDARNDYLESLKPAKTASQLDLGQVMAKLNEMLPMDAVLTVDAGNFSGWPQRYLSFGGSRRMLGPISGAMGYGAPAAVAAKLAFPGRCVVGFAGDGGFAMTGHELATASLYNVAPVIIVFNNGMYGTIRMHQERRYAGRIIASGLSSVDFAALAKAYGAHGERVEKTAEFQPAFRRAQACGKAALIELVCDPENIATRTTISQIRQER